MLAEPPILQTPPEAPQRWGVVLWSGFAIFLAVGITTLFSGLFLGLGLGFWAIGSEVFSDPLDVAPLLPSVLQPLFSGDGITVCGGLLGLPLGVLLIWKMANRTGLPVREYLGLKWPGFRQGLGWGLLILAMDFGYFFLVDWLDLSWSGDTSYIEIGRVPLLVPLLALRMAVLGPAFEELLFRGFLLEGLRRSRLGELGGILITSSLWAVIHPGGPVLWLGLVIYGALLGHARLRTGSTYLPMVIHGISNLVVVVMIAKG